MSNGTSLLGLAENVDNNETGAADTGPKQPKKDDDAADPHNDNTPVPDTTTTSWTNIQDILASGNPSDSSETSRIWI